MSVLQLNGEDHPRPANATNGASAFRHLVRRIFGAVTTGDPARSQTLIAHGAAGPRFGKGRGDRRLRAVRRVLIVQCDGVHRATIAVTAPASSPAPWPWRTSGSRC